MDKIFTTLKQIRSQHPCGIRRKDEYGYNLLAKTLGRGYGDNTPLTFKQIYEINGYDDALWALRAINSKWNTLLRHFVLDAADDVRGLMDDRRSVNAVKAARRVADGEIDVSVLGQAWKNARDAAWETSKDLVWGANRNTARAVSRGVAMDAVVACGDIRILRTIKKDWVEATRTTVSSSAAALALASGSPSTKEGIRELQMARLFKYCEVGERVYTVGSV